MNSAFVCVQPVRERSALEAGAIAAMDVRRCRSLAPDSGDQRARELHGVVRGVVEQLDREQFLRIVELDRRSNESRDDVALVVNRQLHDDVGSS